MKHRLLLIQIITGLLIVLCAGLVFFPLSKLASAFGGGYCLLYAHIYVKWNSNSTVTLDLQKSVFENQSECDFTVYINVCLALVSAIFIWFCIHNKVTGEGHQDESRLLVPMLLFHAVFFVCVFVSAVQITEGFSEWCSFLEENNLYRNRKFKCSQYEKFTWTTKGLTSIYTYSAMAEACSWLLCGLVGFQCFMTGLNLIRRIKSAMTDEDDVEAKKPLEVSGVTNHGLTDDASLSSTNQKASPGSDPEHFSGSPLGRPVAEVTGDVRSDLHTGLTADVRSDLDPGLTADVQVHAPGSLNDSSGSAQGLPAASYNDRANLIKQD